MPWRMRHLRNTGVCIRTQVYVPVLLQMVCGACTLQADAADAHMYV